jgi:hypothetical protein
MWYWSLIDFLYGRAGYPLPRNFLLKELQSFETCFCYMILCFAAHKPDLTDRMILQYNCSLQNISWMYLDNLYVFAIVYYKIILTHVSKLRYYC